MAILVPTAYLPPVSYMAQVSKTNAVVVESFETYPKQTYRNHCIIFGPNGRQMLSIPVNKVNGNHTLTREVEISDHQPWQKIHWRSIETAYRNSPFFLYYQDIIARFFEKRYTYLLDFNTELLQALLQTLKITATISHSSSFEKTPAGLVDLRTTFGRKSLGDQPQFPRYMQVFEPYHGFQPGLSIIDLLFNLGPESLSYLQNSG